LIRKRRLILKNNDRLTAAAKSSGSSPAATSIQDQGFARPSILILLPFRSSALSWLASLTLHTPSPAYQIENHARFAEEYGLPKGAVDKLASAEPGTYPPDHVATFKGNIDESFRVGLKLTRKTVKLFSEFYGSDIILASPLGLKLSAEKEKYVLSLDFLFHPCNTLDSGMQTSCPLSRWSWLISWTL
jgi:U3 small nucleolar RNA-associated protein 25